MYYCRLKGITHHYQRASKVNIFYFFFKPDPRLSFCWFPLLRTQCSPEFPQELQVEALSQPQEQQVGNTSGTGKVPVGGMGGILFCVHI